MKNNNAKKKSAARKKGKSAHKSAQKSGKKGGRSVETLEDAFIHELSDMRNAEMQLTKALPKMAKAAANEDLARAFETHLKETKQQVELIDQAVESCGIRLKNEKCDAMEGLVKEGDEIIGEVAEGPVRDALLISAAQKVEHYEIASYGCLVAVAKQLGYSEAADLLEQILDQEKSTDEKLNQLAEEGINEDAAMQDETQEGNQMARNNRQSNNNGNGSRRGRTPQRDDEGRFVSDDDRNGGGRRSSRGSQYDERRYSRSGRDDDNGGNYYSSSQQGRGGYYDDDRSYRASRGSYGDDDGDGRYGLRTGGYDSDYEDDRNGYQGSGRGWFGDPEGHARAGRQSHGGRNGSSSRSR